MKNIRKAQIVLVALSGPGGVYRLQNCNLKFVFNRLRIKLLCYSKKLKYQTYIDETTYLIKFYYDTTPPANNFRVDVTSYFDDTKFCPQLRRETLLPLCYSNVTRCVVFWKFARNITRSFYTRPLPPPPP